MNHEFLESFRTAIADQVIVVTGASRGIGREIAISLGRLGAKVVLAAKSERERLPRLPGDIRQTAAAVEEAGGEALAVKTDVRRDEDLDRLIESALERFGRIDALVNNAGALWWEDLLDTPAKRFDLVMDVNVRAAFLLSRAVAAHLTERSAPGRLVMMSPALDTQPHPKMIAYTISKFGMTATALGLAEELRSKNVACNALWPATLIESQATINWGMQEPRMWRKASIVADATVALLAQPYEFTGQCVSDESMLRTVGVNDFEQYRVDPDHEPPSIPYSAITSFLEGRPKRRDEGTK